jgi:hypothetical protein
MPRKDGSTLVRDRGPQRAQERSWAALGVFKGGVQVAVAIVDDDFVVTKRLGMNNKGYVTHGREFLHRAVMGLDKGDGKEVDHLNRNKLDCRRANLRIVSTRLEQMQNVSPRGGSSRYRGVTWNKGKGKWQAQCMVNYRCHYLGLFEDELDAARVNLPRTVEENIGT